ncbi:hypothetical protein [Pyrobaculum aerophilum]|nr:hypothetical protein [Pyrobaculum aerophilum]
MAETLLGQLLANNYITFGVMLSSSLLMPVVLGFHRGATARLGGRQ